MPYRKITLLKDDITEHTDSTHVRGVHEGDQVVFTGMVRTYLDMLTRYAFSFLGDEDTSHDIVQDVFARVWQLGIDWNPNGRVGAYLFLAVRRRAFNLLRDARVREKAHNALGEYLRVVITQADPYADIALGSLVAKEISRLTDRQRDAVRLRFGQGLTVREVAEILEIDLTAAERLIVRAIVTLRSRLEKVRGEVE